MKRINILTLIIFLICNIFLLPIEVIANTENIDVAITECNTEKEFIDTTIAFIQNRRSISYSQRTVQRALKRLMDEGKIKHVGSNRFGHYVIK